MAQSVRAPLADLRIASCRKIIVRHGGEITAESEPGKRAVSGFTCRRIDIDADPTDDLKNRRSTSEP